MEVEEKMEEKTTDGKCGCCGGAIVEKIVNKFDPVTEHLGLGPVSQGQFKKVSEGLHCRNCGLKYAFIPKEPALFKSEV